MYITVVIMELLHVFIFYTYRYMDEHARKALSIKAHHFQDYEGVE